MTDPAGTISEEELESLFLMESGRLGRGLERVRLARGARLHARRMAAILAALTWLPLVILALVERVAWGDRVEVPLLQDFLPYGQFLVAVPVLVLGEIIVGRRLGRTVAELRRSDILVPEDTPALNALLTRAVALWRGRRVNALILLLTVTTMSLSLIGVQEWLTGSWQYVGDRVTMPGWWYVVVSLSVLRFLTLRWVWRLLLWAWVLRRTAKLKLQPRSTHPDRAGGLGFLGATQASFGVLVFALGVQLSCLIADAVAYQGADLMAFRGHVTAFVLTVVCLLLLPLLPFTPRLVRTRAEGLVFLSGRGYQGAELVEHRLGANGSEGWPSDDISGLADFGMLYENARGMKPLPVDLRHLVVLATSALLPFLPLVFLVMPAQEVLETLAKLLV